MDLVAKHKIYYSNRNSIPIKDIADSLLALEELIHQTPDILEALFPGTVIQRVEVSLSELHTGSLWEDVGVKFIFGSQEKMDAFIENARDKMGMEKLVSNPQLFTAIIATLILSGGAYYYGSTQSKAQEKATIEANNNVIINIGAGMVELSPESFKVLIDGAIKDKQKLSKSAIRIVSPAKSDTEASIVFDDSADIKIDKASVQAMPRSVAEPEREEEIEDFENIEVILRAVDLDSHKRGWAAVLPSIHKTRRVRLQLDPTVDPNHLMEHPRIIGNVTVLYRFKDEGERYPYLVFLREIIEPQQQKK
jgi:hypothetical protein